MTETLSSDELDALLNDFTATPEPKQKKAGAGLTSEQKEVASVFEDSLKTGAGNMGMMIGAPSSLTSTEQILFSGNDISQSYGQEHIVILMEMTGPLHGQLALVLESADAAKIIARANGVDASAVTFGPEDLSAFQELAGPTLLGIAQMLSGKFGGQIHTELTTHHIISGQSFPLNAMAAISIHGQLNLTDIGEGELALLIPTDVNDAVYQKIHAGSTGPAKGKKVEKGNLELLMEVQMPLTVELGRTRKYIKEILGLGEGSILELDKNAGDAVDLMVNGKMIARGEVVVIDENFGVRVTEIVNPKERLKMDR